MSDAFTYKNAGVDIDAANKTKSSMAEYVNSDNSRLLNKIGAFSALYDFSFPEYKEPVLVLKTEEPGSKQLLAFQYNRIESICYDMINHLINDCIVMGAKPLTVQDAIICGKLEKEKVLRIVEGISKACKDQDCLLTGGETSEQPGVINEGVYILTSSITGVVEKSKIIDGSKISIGDDVLCLESSGLHTNGYTLIRNLMKHKPPVISELIDGQTFIDRILEPHRCYYQAVKGLFETNKIKGMAHITGGGVAENLDRILPANIDAVIDLASYKLLPIFRFLKSRANLEDKEMLRTFNMGVGLSLVCSKDHSADVISHIESKGISCYKIGETTAGSKKVTFKNSIKW